jgi:excisionase family DNA binding protein
METFRNIQSHVDPSTSSSTSPPPSARGLRITQAAEYLGSTPWFVEVAIRSKKIPAHKLGRHYVIFKDDLDDYVTRLRNGAGAAQPNSLSSQAVS